MMTQPSSTTDSAGPVLEVRDLKKHFGGGSRLFREDAATVFAVDGVSFSVAPGETLALVGESGCGKSTVAKAILRLFDVTDGEVILSDQPIGSLPESQLRPYRRNMQVVFQDPFSSLNPRMKVQDIIAEPLRNYGLVEGQAALRKRVAELLDLVSLPAHAADRWPHQFSGGQRQRIGIARALAVNPSLLICDESVSALDVSVQAQILNLLHDLQAELGLAMLFISHDLAVVENISHRIAVMYLGRIVEIAPTRTLIAKPQHPYTEALLSAVPTPDPTRRRKRVKLQGDVPSPLNPPKGCHFHPRCPYAFDLCRVKVPVLTDRAGGAKAACHLDDLASAQTRKE